MDRKETQCGATEHELLKTLQAAVVIIGHVMRRSRNKTLFITCKIEGER